MICETCRNEVGKIRFIPGHGWDCPRCADPERQDVNTLFSPTLFWHDGFGRVSVAQEKKWREDGAFIDRQVDPKTGNVNTFKMTKRQGTVKYFPMSR